MTEEPTKPEIVDAARHRPSRRHLQLARPTALGRQEDWERPPGRSDGPAMSWLHRHDQYRT